MQHRINDQTPLKVGWDAETEQPTIELATVHSKDTWVFTYGQLVMMLTYIEKLNEETGD